MAQFSSLQWPLEFAPHFAPGAFAGSVDTLRDECRKALQPHCVLLRALLRKVVDELSDLDAMFVGTCGVIVAVAEHDSILSRVVDDDGDAETTPVPMSTAVASCIENLMSR